MSKAPVTWALIPVKASGEGKTRLAGALSGGQREALVSAMLRHVAGAARAAEGIARTMLVGAARHGLASDIPLLDDPGTGLNAALAQALGRIAAREDHPDRVIVIAADLPRVTVLDMELLVKTAGRSIGIAPDRHGTGTNALSLPLPEAAAFRFCYGTDSAAEHGKEAARLGLSVETILSEGLEKDIDEPSDLIDAREVYTF